MTISGRWKLNTPNKNGQIYIRECFSDFLSMKKIPGTVQLLTIHDKLNPSEIVSYTDLSLIEDSGESYIEYHTVIINEFICKMVKLLIAQGISIFAVPFGIGEARS